MKRDPLFYTKIFFYLGLGVPLHLESQWGISLLKKGVLFFVLIVSFAGTLPQVIEQSLFWFLMFKDLFQQELFLSCAFLYLAIYKISASYPLSRVNLTTPP